MSGSGLAEPSTKSASPRGGHRSTVLKVLIVLVVLAAVYFAWSYFTRPVNKNELFASGRLEGYETNLSPKIGGRIEWIKYREGAAVKTGELLATLNDEDYQAQLRGAIARIAKAQQGVKSQADQLAVVQAQIAGATKRLFQSREETSAQISQAAAGLKESDAKYKQAQADVTQARSDLQLATVRLARYTDLVKKGAVTKDEYDQAVTTFNNDNAIVNSKIANEQAAQRAVQSAQAALSQAKAARYTPPIRTTDVNVSQAQLDQAQKQLKANEAEVKNAMADRDQILANLDYLRIRSPINGVVTARPVEPGAVLAPGQTILTVLNYDEVYMRAFIPEGDIARVHIGNSARVYLDAIPKKAFAGKVIEIDSQGSFTPENIYFKNDRVKQVFGIKIGIAEPGGLAKPGMPADAYIEL